jgi:hypothetical protein
MLPHDITATTQNGEAPAAGEYLPSESYEMRHGRLMTLSCQRLDGISCRQPRDGYAMSTVINLVLVLLVQL